MTKLRRISSRWLMCVALLFFAALLLWPAGVLPQGVRDKEKLQQNRKKLEEEIRQTTEILNQTRKNKETSVNRLQTLTRQIRNREALIRAINLELNDLQATLSADSILVSRMTKQLDGMKTEYARMIRLAYRAMNGRSLLTFLFSAGDFNQAFLRLQYYRQFSAYRRTQAERIAGTRKAIETRRAGLAVAAGEKQDLVRSKQQEKQRLDDEKTQKSNSVKELSAKEKTLLATIKTKQQAADKLERAIEKLIADELHAARERAKKKDAPAATSGEKALSAGFHSNRGRLPWPCDQGFISGSFGEHPHPVLPHVKVKNNGIDILTGRGSAVKAVFGGKVSRVMAFSGINHVVIIRHGEYLTVYSNLAEVNVRDGQEVSLRQVIGKVYDPPGEERSELHFELWHGKEIQNPEHWLTRK